MKSRIPLYVSALLAAGSVSVAVAQGAQHSQQSGARSSAIGQLQFVQEPIATATRATGRDAQVADAIVTALDADSDMKDSKITVQADTGKVLLTGATLTRAQKKRAGEIAIAQAGEGNVVNAILDDET